MQLATVSADGKPRVRTVVFRGFNALNNLEFITDARSEKVGQIMSTSPAAELCWWFPVTREQFRVEGTIRSQIWRHENSVNNCFRNHPINFGSMTEKCC